jgi:serine/threonine protein kinase
MGLSSIFRRSERATAERLGPYVLGPKIGQGGMGAVYRARHAGMKRTVAIKMLGNDASQSSDPVRFEREVQLARRLGSPNIVTIYDHGRTPKGTPYYVMEYVDGYDLENLVATFGPLPPARVVHLLRQICDALAAVHDAGLVHRDVKPANVGLTAGGGSFDVVKLFDFGLVKQMDPPLGAPSSTLANAVIGTPGYLAPEAITSPDAIEARSDLYAVGALAYYLLTGTRVFQGNNAIVVCAQHLQSTPQPPSERAGRPIPADLEALVLRCLEKDPARRPQSARALQAQLAACACANDWQEQDAADWWRNRPLPKPELMAA